jgi:alpha-beta hydrolase superfamily lysophospholipase
VQTHKYREPIGPPPGAAYAAVTFPSRDGLRLSAWYARSANRAAVVVVHGGGGDRTGALRHAALLHRHGYGVLVYDARGRGESQGSPNGFGWGWQDDAAGALAFLARRSDVDPARIGGLGLSTGADVLIQAAARDRRLKAVVADGASAESFADYRNYAGIDFSTPFYWTMYAAARIFSGSAPGEPLLDAVARVAPTPLLLVATGRSIPQELAFNRMYADAAHEPVELWSMPDVAHTGAIRERPRQYEQRVVGFFDRAILSRRASSGR